MEQIRKLPRPIEVGVYFLFKGRALLYVGQSMCVSNRIASHRASGKIQFDNWIVIAAEPDDLDAVEAVYIRRYSPPHNVGRRRVSHPCTHPQMSDEGTRTYKTVHDDEAQLLEENG
jgi:hypothetical protein